MKQVGWGLLLLFGTCFCNLSCSGEDTPKAEPESIVLLPSKLRLDQVCRAIQQDDYKALVALTYSYKDKPEKYQEQLYLMLKQHDALRVKDSSFIVNIVPTRQRIVAPGNVAVSYFDVTYLNGKNEEILLPLIYHQGRWWIK